MKNQDDYKAGWTGKTYNPKTGKWSSGGAARNMNLARAGGAESVRASGYLAAVEQLAPLMQRMEAQLEASANVIKALARRNPGLMGEIGFDTNN